MISMIFFASKCFLCTGLDTVPAACANAVHTKGLVPTTCPLVCASVNPIRPGGGGGGGGAESARTDISMATIL